MHYNVCTHAFAHMYTCSAPTAQRCRLQAANAAAKRQGVAGRDAVGPLPRLLLLLNPTAPRLPRMLGAQRAIRTAGAAKNAAGRSTAWSPLPRLLLKPSPRPPISSTETAENAAVPPLPRLLEKRRGSTAGSPLPRLLLMPSPRPPISSTETAENAATPPLPRLLKKSRAVQRMCVLKHDFGERRRPGRARARLGRARAKLSKQNTVDSCMFACLLFLHGILYYSVILYFYANN